MLKIKDKKYIEYICEWCAKKFKSPGTLSVKLCPACKANFNRDKAQKKYIPKKPEENFYKLQEERNSRIAKLNEEGMSAQNLADQFHVTKTRILQILKKLKK